MLHANEWYSRKSNIYLTSKKDGASYVRMTDCEWKQTAKAGRFEIVALNEWLNFNNMKGSTRAILVIIWEAFLAILVND